MKKIRDLIIAQGIGSVGLYLSYKGYKLSKEQADINEIIKQARAEQATAGEDRLKAFDATMEAIKVNENNVAKAGRFNEAAQEHQDALKKYNANPTDINKQQLLITQEKIKKAFDEISTKNIGSFLTDLYNNYERYLETLSPDKIVSIFNIILNGMLLTSFFSVLSILLSDSILNKLTFLEKWPRVLKILRFRNSLNRKVSVVILAIHFLIITSGFILNVLMFLY
jgi:hypothetical protein